MTGCDYVLHHAAKISVPEGEKEPIQYVSVNVEGTHNVLAAAHLLGVKRVVLASSCAVEGPSVYGMTKRLNELFASKYYTINGLETVCLRYQNVFGERQSLVGEGAAIPIFITRLLTGQDVTIYGDGEQTREFVYVKDIAEANIRALRAPQAPGRVYNIATGRVVTVNELYNAIQGILGINRPPIYAPLRPGEIVNIDPKHCDQDLCWGPLSSFAEGLQSTIRYYDHREI
jgi:nucleoside-diphosphate-sugar epimerase